MESPFDQAQKFGSMWTDFATRLMQTGMSFDPGRAPPDIARDVRSAVFASMAQQTEQFMRSPQFLEAMKQSMDAAVSFRKEMNDALTAAQHSVQGVARQDIDSLMLSVRHIETRLLDSVEAVTTRLDAICRRLDELESSNNHGRKRVPTGKPPAAAPSQATPDSGGEPGAHEAGGSE